MWVKLRATEEERQAWYAKAQAKGVTFSEFARKTLSGVAVRRRTQLRHVDPALLRALAQLSNQFEAIVRHPGPDRTAMLAALLAAERELAALRKAHEVRDAG
jgi:erythromycin esterase-like protein